VAERLVDSMRLWLASYPRSGNTLTRMILNQAFGVKSTSVYERENSSMQEVPWLRDRIGYAGDLRSIDQPSPDWVAVKTHGHPTDDDPAIYVVRDGRAAIVSYAHWLGSNSDIRPTIEELIEGNVWPGSWTGHFDAWSPERRPHTLLLRYEDLRSGRADAFQKISRFLMIPQLCPFTQEFEELNKLEPTLFRTADNEQNVKEMRQYEGLFYSIHGDLMNHLQYGNAGVCGRARRAVRKICEIAASKIRGA
jgi:hypothetical protein